MFSQRQTFGPGFPTTPLVPLQACFHDRCASGFFAALRYSRAMEISREQPVSMRRSRRAPEPSPTREIHHGKQGT
jgi:hypothetical protein